MATINNDTLLCNLPDHLVDECQGFVYDLLRSAGYDERPRRTIDNLCWWTLTVGQMKWEIEEMNAQQMED